MNFSALKTLMNLETNCTGGVPWILDILGECVLDTKTYISVILGMLSLFIFIIAASPQLITNCRTGIVDEAISIGLILCWLAGDSTNLIGCFLTDQLPLQKWSAIYYVLIDMLLLGQYVYCKWKHMRRNRRLKVHSVNIQDEGVSHSRLLQCIFALWGISYIGISLLPFQATATEQVSVISHMRPAGRTLLQETEHHTPGPVFTGTGDIIGYVCGIISTCFYMGSRLPQLLLNFRRKSTEGVNIGMFILIVSGNLTYGSSIIVKSTEEVFILQHLPWIVGSYGMILIDIITFSQFYYYRGNKAIHLDENTEDYENESEKPLLDEDEHSVEY
ncbi:lysosomal amino acid transporter 1 homolog [Lingula anatina]|uniref:Lysosomal amino acid transporter 1 homolog n=1 Tax=Lingula anatina TaxID=7574 RepID=A0A1S3H707_LINAN|nr:lysosomal amino acid transporter 1 homolog [Lingula anatina]XP_013381905.1 lysosomal amino acid transporter 1 homolog [Lingula anatina]XP_013381906.1 lysosomal amino acid transporter 1 homolog [Lingula anatina]|eukprot:XP_013381904.1 lysosomal amino acid transporter 1 homolog [Lingula anatina]